MDIFPRPHSAKATMVAYSFVSIQRENDVTATANAGGSISIVTAPMQWSYAAIFPSVGGCANEVATSIKAVVTHGAVGVLNS
jgi:hypothetical protein